MAEPTTSAAGGIAVVKYLGAPLMAGLAASTLGFLVLMPKTFHEAVVRVAITMICSAVFGPILLFVCWQQYPGIFTAAGAAAAAFGAPAWMGLIATAVPILAIAGLPGWWVIGAIVLWLEKRKDKDIGELAHDAAAVVKDVVSEVKS
jgi:hypothetical protein